MPSPLQLIRSAASWASGASGMWSPITSYASPWATRDKLAGLVLTDGARAAITGAGTVITVQDALRVPAVARAAAQITSAVATIGLKARDDNGAAVDLAWLSGPTTGPVSGAYMWAQCALDLLWQSATVLIVTARDGDGYPTAVERVPLGLWSLETDRGVVLIDGQAVDQSTIIYVPGLVPLGFLDAAAEHVAHYMALIRTIGSRSRNPIPMIDLHLDEEWVGDDEELEEVRDAWAAARRHENGAVGISPRGVNVRPLLAGSSDDQAMLIQARNAARLDIANFANLPANMLEGDNGASGTYQNTLQVHSEFVRLSLPLFMAPIAARLSQDDVTPPGVTVYAPLDDLDDSMTDPHGNTTNRAAPTPVPAPQEDHTDA